MDPLAFLRTKQAVTIPAEAYDAATEQALHDAFKVDEVQPIPTLIEHNLGSVERVINKLADQERMLEHQIAERQERLRQTRVTLQAFNAARTILAADGEPPLYEDDQP